MAKAGKKQAYHGKRPCQVARKLGDDVVIEYTDEAGGQCRVPENKLTEEPS